MEASGSETTVSERSSDHSGQTDSVTAEERAQWLIDYIILHQSEERAHLLRRAVEQFVAVETSAFERGQRAARPGS
jgi:Uri superfamily endonuclease